MTLVKNYKKENIALYQAECLEFLSTLDDDSVDLIATDPPYFKVKDDAWDHQWPNKQAFFDWLSLVLSEYHRVLKPAGSLYLFAGPHLATEVELVVAGYFDMLNQIVWRKPTGRHLGCNKESLRRFFPQTEHVLFAESGKKVPFAYGPVLDYLENARLAAGVSRKEVDQACGCQMSGHWFGRSQFSIPSESHYVTLNQLFGYKLKPYVEFKAHYLHIRDKSNERRRTFNVTKAVPYTNVWDFPVVNPYPGKHPCEKPIALMEHIIKTSSLPGDVVLDSFSGSGSTAIACMNTGRKFIGCEMGDVEFDMAVGRIENLVE